MTTLIAHRGASAEAPENTLAAIRMAIDLRVDCIEMDLHLSKDGVPVVIHDSSLLRTTDEKRPLIVEELTLREIKQLDAGAWFGPAFAGEAIPTLQEVLDLNRHGAGLMLEIKKGRASPREIADRVLAVLPREEPTITIGSFEPEIVRAVQSASSYSLIGIVEESHFTQTFLRMGLKKIAIWSKILEPRQTDALHEEGVTVWVFTVDDVKSAQFLRSIGVDGIITNNPRRIRSEVLDAPSHLL